MRRIDTMKKAVCLMLVLLCTLQGGCALFPAYSEKNAQEIQGIQQTQDAQNAQAEPTAAATPDEKIETISGTVSDGSMNTLTLITDDGKTYSFLTEGVDIHATQAGILIGDPVTVTYIGTLDDTASEQTVAVQSIDVGSN